MQVDHTDLAVAVYHEQPPEHTVTGALSYLTRLLGRLPPAEAAGYLAKPSGENIAPLADGTLVSVSRVCYPDRQIYKVMRDAPNGPPAWDDNGVAPPGQDYHPFVPPTGPPPPAPPGPSIADVLEQLQVVKSGVQDLWAQHQFAARQLAENHFDELAAIADLKAHLDNGAKRLEPYLFAILDQLGIPH